MAGRARPGWDVTSGALCIVGIPRPPRLVPVHSAEEPGGGGERGARGREARKRAGQRGARRKKARAAQRAQAGHLAAAAAAKPPVSAARAPSPHAPAPPPGSGRCAFPAAGVWEQTGLPLICWRCPGPGRCARRGPCWSLACMAPSQALPVPCGIPFGFVQKSKPGSQLLTTASSCPGAFVGGKKAVRVPPSATLPRVDGQTAGPEARGGPAALGGQLGPGRPGAVVRVVGLGETTPARELPACTQ